jgi:hypothetical protein
MTSKTALQAMNPDFRVTVDRGGAYWAEPDPKKYGREVTCTVVPVAPVGYLWHRWDKTGRMFALGKLTTQASIDHRMLLLREPWRAHTDIGRPDRMPPKGGDKKALARVLADPEIDSTLPGDL